MGKILDLVESSLLAGYCIYRILAAFHLLAQNAKFASENNVYGRLENHNWPEIEITFAIMAIAGLISGRRFVFCFTVFFFLLRTANSITDAVVDVYTLSSGKSINCIVNKYFSSDCTWSDMSVLIQDLLTFISLALMSAIVFLRLFSSTSVKHNYRNEPIAEICTEKQQQQTIKLPFFMKHEKENRNDICMQTKYNINYNDNPYQSSVI